MTTIVQVSILGAKFRMWSFTANNTVIVKEKTTMKMNKVLPKFGFALLVLMFVLALSSESTAQVKFGRETLKAGTPLVVTLVHVKGHVMVDDRGLNKDEIKIPVVFNEVEVEPKVLTSTYSLSDKPSGSAAGPGGLSLSGMSLKLSGNGTMSLSPGMVYAAFYPGKNGESTGSSAYLDNLCKDHWTSAFTLPATPGFVKGTMQLLDKTVDYKAPTAQLQLKIDCRPQ